MRMPKPSGSSGMGSPKTIGPEAIVTRLAAALVAAITGTAAPCWRLRAETVRPISESVAITNASGWRSTSQPSFPSESLSALIETSEAPHRSPAPTPTRGAPARPRRQPPAAAPRPAAASSPA
jgi:hypothetical protein